MASSRLPLRRLQWIDERLRSGKFATAERVAQELEVSVRTIYRDIEYMRDQMDAPVEFDRGRKGYYYADHRFRLPAVQLTEGEVVAVFVAEKALRAYRGTPFEKPLRSAFEKITRALSDPISFNFAGFCSTLSFDLGPLCDVPEETFHVLCKAAADQEKVFVRYHTQSRNVDTERVIEPYRLHNHRGNWYVIAFCHLRGQVRDFLLSRVLHAEPRNEFFQIPEDFDVDEYIRRSFGIMRDVKPTKVVLQFDAHQARYIRERQWHETQKLRDTGDGGCKLTMTVTGLDEVRCWVLSHGRHVRVIAPEALRRAVASEAQALLRSHNR